MNRTSHFPISKAPPTTSLPWQITRVQPRTPRQCSPPTSSPAAVFRRIPSPPLATWRSLKCKCVPLAVSQVQVCTHHFTAVAHGQRFVLRGNFKCAPTILRRSHTVSFSLPTRTDMTWFVMQIIRATVRMNVRPFGRLLPTPPFTAIMQRY